MEEQDVAPTVVVAPPTEKKIRMKSPSPGFRGRSQTPIRGRSMTPLMRFREKSATPMDPMTWRSITPFIQREEVEKTPFEIGSNIILQLASYKAIIDKACVMDISAEEEPLAKYILSEHSVIDRAAVMDISNVEIIYVEDDFIDECESDASSVRESESRESSVMDERPSEEGEEKPEEEEVSEKKKKKEKKVKKAPKKKEKKEKEPSPPKLKLDLGGPPPPKVNKAKLFEQQQKAAAEAPMSKPPPKKSGKLAGALAAMQQQEAAAKEAELQRQQIEEKMKQMKEEQANKQQQEEEEGEGDGEERGSQIDSEYRSRSGSGSRSGSEDAGSNVEEQEDEDNNEEAEGEEDEDESGAETESSIENFTRPDNDYGEWDKYDDQQGVIRSKYERKKHKKMSERERDIEWQKAREAARYPRIHAHLKDSAIEEGHSIKLTCTVSGPELNIKWLKDGHPLEKSPKYRVLVNEGIVSLEILRTLPSDSGEYTCALSNNNGDASTTAIVTIYDVIKDDPTPPTFTLVRDYYHLNEDVLGIEVHCTGTPRPKITWIRDMVEVVPSYKHTLLEEAHGVYKLEIYKPSFKDNGRYMCRAENVMAEEEITHNVSFIKPKHFHIRGIQHAHSELMKEKEEAAKRAMEEALRAKEEYEMRRTGKLPPRSRPEPEQHCSQKDRLKFATQLRDRTAIVGNKVKFTVSVVGPDPNIRWFKDGNPIVYGPSIRNSTADGMSILEMTHLTADQTGEYRCHARNDHSEVSTSCYLKIYEAKSAGDKEAPLFVLSMRDVYHTQENDLVIDCKVRGNPRPIIFWQKDELPIEFDERTQQIEHGDGLCELIINKPTTKDSGNYACTATNAIGSQKIVHKVEFTPQPSSRRDSGMQSDTASESGRGKGDATGAVTGVESGAESSATQAAGKGGKRPPRPKAEPAPEETMSRRSAGPTFEELQKAARNKLSFVTHLTNRVFAEGSKVKLSCVVQGPDPNVRWLKDENPLVYSARVKNLSRDGMCVLEIDKCTPDDSGDYKLIVRNQDSDISSGCTLQVYEVSQSSDFAPTFTRAPKHTYHLNTNEIYLETHVRGQPMPKVEWVKDGVTIAKEDEKYHQIDHPDGTCELIVNFPKPNDSGKYVCKAYNRAGECSVQHSVLFEGKAAHIIDNRHRVYHSDPDHLAKAKTEFPEKARENGVTEPKPEPEEEKGKGKGRGRGSKGTGSAQNTRTESSPVPEPTPVVTRQKEPPRESKKTIYFASKLSDRVVAEGSKVKLTCYLDGSDPSIRWFKDEQPVVYTPKCRQSNLNGVCCLEFTAVAEADSGVYRCYARNTTGEVSTSAKLEVFPSPGSPDSAPTFTRSIKDTYHTQLNEVKLSCHCRGFPTPAITWVKDGVTIEPSEKYLIEDKEDGTCELTINYPNKQDNGKYVLQGENRAGKAEISHLVQLQLKDAPPRLPPPHPAAAAAAEAETNGTNGVEDDTNSLPKGRKKGKGERESVASSTVREGNWVSRYHEIPIDPKTKLHFAAFLTDRTMAEGGKTKLSAYVEGPDPNIRWLKDDNPVVLSSNCRSQLRDGLVTLDMAQLKPEDSGVYKLICRNQSGEISCSCKLMVYEVVKEDLTAPLFSVPIKDTYNLNSDELILECRVRGSKPTITWTKNNEFIESNDKYQQFDQADGYCKLIINNPEEKDSGQYTCKAENSMSSDKVTHNVVFNGRDAYILEKTHGYFHRDINKPHFQNAIGDHMITQGGVIALQADILHGPVDVQWYRDHSQIVPGDKVRAFQDHGIHTLIIPDAKHEVSGTYTCVASNAFGKVESVGHVHIVGPSVKGGKCPLFQSRPETEMLIMTGDPFSFSFRLIGEPKPKLIFMKGLKDITQSDRVLKETQDDYIRFTVQRSNPMDSGTYWIIARNEHGTDRAFVTITVKQRARSITPSYSSLSYPIDDFADVQYLKNPPDPISSEPICVDSGRNHISLSWGKSHKINSAPVLAYKVEAWLIGIDGGARWQELGITPINSFDAFNLRSGCEYHFRVTPKNRYGWGKSTQTSSPILMGGAQCLPEFTKILPGQLKALSGMDFTLECSVKGTPKPEICWYRDGVQIRQNDQVSIRSFGSICRLTIKGITDRYSGRYTCEATNCQGRVSTFARLQVVTDPRIYAADSNLKRNIDSDLGSLGDMIPQFTMRLRERRIQVTYPVRLTCQAVGWPSPLITWHKDGVEVEQSDRIKTFHDGQFNTLEISKTTLSDTGIYTASAKNESGEVSCHCNLYVDKGIRGYIAPEFYCSFDPIYRIKSGNEIRISGQIEAYPTVGVTWQRNGIRLRPSRRLTVTLDQEGFVELVISDATQWDAGIYTCIASNAVGLVESNCRVIVDELDEENKIKVPDIRMNVPYSKEPMFVTKPRSSQAFEGDTVIIYCEVIGDPKPDVVWLRDFLKPDYYKDAPHFRRIGDGPEYRLEIPHAKLDFTGTYSVIATNFYGEAKAIISLQIYAKDLNKSNAMNRGGSIKHGNVETLPIFTRPLKDLRCCDGDSITLECHVEAQPEPTVIWEKDGRVLPHSNDFRTHFCDDRATLSISRVFPEDEGEYTCVALNNIGKSYTSACIIVDVPEEKENLISRILARPSGLLSTNSTPRSTPRTTPVRSISPMPLSYRSTRIDLSSKQHKCAAPKFYAMPHNRLAEEGETVRFQCAIAGHPIPWSTWDKDGNIVTPTTRINIKERDDLRILEIEEVTMEDAGLYRITLENEYGRIEATARLDIIANKRSSGHGIRTSASPRRSISSSRRIMGNSTRIGGRLALACNFRGGSVPNKKFYHNGTELPPTDRVRTIENDETSCLVIDNVQAEDEGVYTCIGCNELGIAATSTIVTFNDTQEHTAPEFIRGLGKTIRAKESYVLDLSCSVVCSDPFEMIWLRDGDVIPDSDDFRYIDHGEGLISLRILDPFVYDSGRYTCTVCSDHGKCETSCDVIIYEVSEQDEFETKPVFIKSPQPVVAAYGAVVSFCARVSPVHAKVKWSICGRALTEDARGILIEHQPDGVHILHVLGLEYRHSGEIKCVAYIPTHPDPVETTVYTDLVVLPTSSSTVSLETNPSEQPEIPAYIIRGPEDCSVLIGGTVTLEAIFGGYSQPKVKWYRAGREITESTNIKIQTSPGYSSLLLTDITADQSGKYSIEIMNEHSCDISSASVSVEGPPDPPGNRPIISQGSDRLSVAWCGPPFDGGVMITGFILEIQEENNDWIEYSTVVDSLATTIKDLKPGVTYRFRVRAENAHGRSAPSAESDEVRISLGNDVQTVFDEDIIVKPGGDFKTRFLLQEELGKGRFGVVHKVVEIESNRTLAAKIVKCIKAVDKQKIQEEISIMQSLRHPKLLQLAAAFENPREMIMVMEFITGGELFERVVADDFTLTERDCILFLRQICEGVDYMHSKSVVHLDLKPENIMCHNRTSHQIKIIDFGLAQRISSDTPVRVLFGTPEFIPPEIINYEPIGFQSDMWSIGVICYVLLSGLSPFMGESDVDTFSNITCADFDFDDDSFDAVSQDAKDFISSLLVHRKEKRLTAKQCLESKWLSDKNANLSTAKICTDKLKKFVIRRKWQTNEMLMQNRLKRDRHYA